MVNNWNQSRIYFFLAFLNAVSADTLADGTVTTVDGGVCVAMVYGGVSYDDCTDDDYAWCATAVDDSGSYTSWGYCGFGSTDSDTCVPMVYGGVSYDACTEESTSGWWVDV